MRLISRLIENASSYRDLVRSDGFILLRDLSCPTDLELMEFGERLSEVTEGPRLLEWPFGVVMTMEFSAQASNYLFSDEEVPLHWDGPFLKEPSFIIFYCDHSDRSDGRTLFIDTELALSRASADQVRRWRDIIVTYKTEKLAHYGGQFVAPVVRRHPSKPSDTIRFCERVESKLNPLELHIEGTNAPEDFYSEICSHLRLDKFSYLHEWRTGDLLVVDNHRYLHGREALGTNTARRFRRVHVM